MTVTEERNKPEIPTDDIFIEEEFKYKKYSIVEAVDNHREFHHPTVFNNPYADIKVSIEFDMTKNPKGVCKLISNYYYYFFYIIILQKEIIYRQNF